MTYVATVNIPGYLPMDDDPPVFGSAADAWAALADERRQAEDAYADAEGQPYSDTVSELDALAQAGAGPDVVYGGTPGYDGDHDLGLAYRVTPLTK